MNPEFIQYIADYSTTQPDTATNTAKIIAHRNLKIAQKISLDLIADNDD